MQLKQLVCFCVYRRVLLVTMQSGPRPAQTENANRPGSAWQCQNSGVRSRKTVAIIGVMLVCLFVATIFMTIPYLGLFGIALALGSFVYLGALFLKDKGQKRYTDPYDLNLLKEIHDRETFEGADRTHIPEDADKVCPHCGHLYGHKFKVCPMCGKMP